jgi:hypothetical protein
MFWFRGIGASIPRDMRAGPSPVKERPSEQNARPGRLAAPQRARQGGMLAALHAEDFAGERLRIS